MYYIFRKCLSINNQVIKLEKIVNILYLKIITPNNIAIRIYCVLLKRIIILGVYFSKQQYEKPHP